MDEKDDNLQKAGYAIIGLGSIVYDKTKSFLEKHVILSKDQINKKYNEFVSIGKGIIDKKNSNE